MKDRKVLLFDFDGTIADSLENNELDIFDYIYSDASIFGKDKVIRSFLKQKAIAKDQAIYSGDETRDIQACKKLGLKMIVVSWGLNSKEGLLNY